MLLTGFDFGFFPIAGWLGLLGMIIKNVIVLLDEINIQRRNGIAPYTAIIEATVSRTRPVLMAATTTILGMVPLLFDIAFGGMAATIIFGLTFATLLTLFVTPHYMPCFIKLRVILNMHPMKRINILFIFIFSVPSATFSQQSDLLESTGRWLWNTTTT